MSLRLWELGKEGDLSRVWWGQTVRCDTSLSLTQYSSFRCNPWMCCVALAQLLSFSVLQLPPL